MGYKYHPHGSGGRVTLDSAHINGTETPMASSSSYEVWNNFFLSAGIPSNVANDYAVTFSQHRIRIDMLKDITKEILLDMGIKAMGDIIAILRHAKDICAQDELKGGINIKATPSRFTNDNVTTFSPSSQPHLKQMPHHASQPSSSKPTRSSLGTGVIVAQSSPSNKIQSRMSLNSGALLSAQHKQHHQVSSDSSGSKRSISSASDSLAKRLKPMTVANDPRYTEKTLTVILPSSSVSRTGHRIVHNNDKRDMPPHKSLTSSSVKSRLGAVPDTAKAGAETHSTLLTYSASRVKSRQSDLRTSLSSGHGTTTSSSLNNTDLHTNFNKKQQTNSQIHRHTDDKSRKDHNSLYKNRSKSAVFSRLG